MSPSPPRKSRSKSQILLSKRTMKKKRTSADKKTSIVSSVLQYSKLLTRLELFLLLSSGQCISVSLRTLSLNLNLNGSNSWILTGHISIALVTPRYERTCIALREITLLWISSPKDTRSDHHRPEFSPLSLDKITVTEIGPRDNLTNRTHVSCSAENLPSDVNWGYIDCPRYVSCQLIFSIVIVAATDELDDDIGKGELLHDGWVLQSSVLALAYVDFEKMFACPKVSPAMNDATASKH